MYGRLYEVGNSLRLLFNCGCSMVQITFRWKIVRQRISQTQNQIFMVLNRIFLQENHMHVKFWCERKSNNSPPHLRLWISWRGTPPILRLISDYAAQAHLQEPEQRRFQFGIFLFSSLPVLLYESSFNWWICSYALKVFLRSKVDNSQEVIRDDLILNWVKDWEVKVKGFDCLGSASFLQILWENVFRFFLYFY